MYKRQVESKTPAVTRSLDEVHDEIRDRLIGIQASSYAEDAAYELFYDAEDLGSLADAAATSGLETKLTEPFALGEPISGIGQEFSLQQTLFKMDEGAIPDVVSVGDLYYVIQIERKEAPRVARFEETKDKAVNMVRQVKALALTEESARKFEQAVREGVPFEEAALSAGGVISPTGPFNRANERIGSVGRAPAVVEAAFAVGPGNVTQAIQYPSGYAAVWVEKLNPADPEMMESQRSVIKTQILSDKASRMALEWFHAAEKLARPTTDPKAEAWIREREG